METETEATTLELELGCPECGARAVVGIWDHSVRCGYCGSLLICGRALGEEVFAVPPARSGPVDIVELIVRAETDSLRAELNGRASDPDRPARIDLPALIDLRVEALRSRLLAELEQVETIDFLVPYALFERTVAQGILGRRTGGKASLLQSFRTEDLERGYDARRWNLRDRGLKIRFSRVTLLGDAARERASDRFLERKDASDAATPPSRARLRADASVQVISQTEAVVRERRLSLWKPMAFVRVRRGAGFEDHLVDRQFETLAGQLKDGEAEAFRALAPRAIAEVVGKPSLRAIASECPNCGADLAVRPRARIAFCANCGTAIRVLPEGLQTFPYLRGDLADATGAEAVVGFPFWSFPFGVRAAGRDFARVWDWLEAVAPQPSALRFREEDPAQSRLFVPARAIFGSRELDEAFVALAACAGWRQPRLRRERFAPAELATQLEVELEPDEAAALARFALLSLHDAQSTRSLNGMNFKKLVIDAELGRAEPELVVLPLPIHAGFWLPLPNAAAPDPGQVPAPLRAVPRALLEDDGQVPRVARAFALR